MNDFDYDAKQKKEIGLSGFHRVGTGDRHGCSLPSDLLTPGEKMKLNGPVQTVNLNKPMNWNEFNDIDSEDLQREYLQGLIDKYRVGSSQIAEMMYVSQMSVFNLCKRIGVKFLPKGHKMVKPEKMAWERFLSGEDAPACCPDSEEHISGGVEMDDTVKKASTLDLATTYDHIPGATELMNLFGCVNNVADGAVRVSIQIEVTPE